MVSYILLLWADILLRCHCKVSKSFILLGLMHPCASTLPPYPPHMPASVSMDALYAQQENIYIAEERHLIKFRGRSRARVNMGRHSCHMCVCCCVCVYENLYACVTARETARECVCARSSWYSSVACRECDFPQFLSELWSQKTGLLKWNTSFPRIIRDAHTHTQTESSLCFCVCDFLPWV